MTCLFIVIQLNLSENYFSNVQHNVNKLWNFWKNWQAWIHKKIMLAYILKVSMSQCRLYMNYKTNFLKIHLPDWQLSLPFAVKKLDIYMILLAYIMAVKQKEYQSAVNSLRPSEAIWRHRSGPTLVQVMACCLTAPSHYLNQCWLIISKVLWLSCEGKFTRDTSIINH